MSNDTTATKKIYTVRINFICASEKHIGYKVNILFHRTKRATSFLISREKKRRKHPEIEFHFFWQTRSHCFFMHSKHRFWIEKYMFSIPFKPSLGCIDSERKERRIFVNNLNVLNISLKVRLRPLPFGDCVCDGTTFSYIHGAIDQTRNQAILESIFFVGGHFSSIFIRGHGATSTTIYVWCF